MRRPTVSVIIPTYNRGHCLHDAINSVLAQSFQDFELIVVDDGSTDETSHIVEAYGQYLKLIRQANAGAASARNTGIMASQGQWVAFLDSDDLWEPDKLEVQMEDLQANPTVVAHMVDARIVISDRNHPSLFEMRRLVAEFTKQPFRARPLCDVLMSPFVTPSWILHRHTIEAAGYFNPALRIAEDIDLLSRIALEGPFYVNCFNGVLIRRIPGVSSALTELYISARLESLQSLAQIYTHLKHDRRLTYHECREVDRLLGGVWCEMAIQHRSQHQLSTAFFCLLRSIVENPGFRALGRALLTLLGVKDSISNLTPKRGKQVSFRRSELEENYKIKRISES